MESGVFDGIDNSVYHAGPGISKSGLELFGRSPLHYWEGYLNPEREPRKETPAMIIGTAIHTAILEPSTFFDRYVVIPTDAPKRPSSTQLSAKKPSDDTIAAIAWWDDFNKSSNGRVILSADDVETCQRISEQVRKNAAANVLLGSGVAERSAYWNDRETGVFCKCRPDWLNTDRRIVVDLKSTEDARPEAFARSIVNYGYHMQAAWYLDGITEATETEHSAFVFIAVEKNPPYAVAFYFADDEMIAAGRARIRTLLPQFKACQEANKWPGYPEQLSPIALPAWFSNKIANDN